MRVARAAAILLSAIGLSGCIGPGGFPGGNAYHETVDVSRALSPSGEVTIENTNGSIRVATWSEPKVRIEATKGAPTRDALRDIEVLVDGEGDRVAIRTRQPKRHLFGPSGQVEYRVTVPHGARVSIKNVNGGVEVAGVEGGLRATTVNGTVDASRIAGAVEAATVNGTVEVAMARVDPTSRNRLNTTNGSVRLTLPRDTSADVEAGTVNGSAHCDFDLAAGASVSRRKLDGRIGQGGARFVLHTVNGTARIDRGLATATARAGSPTTPAPAEAVPATPER
jgi:DUF4097 and DUF4098 domain-containing protein YvlB